MTYAPTEEARPVVFWEHRTYPGHLSELRRVRADLATDLAGFDADLVDTLQLVTSELLANCVKYTDSGSEGGEVIRALSMPDPCTVRVSLSDFGGGGTTPLIPARRSADEWNWAEGQRGLLLVENLSTAWGHFRLAPWADVGTHVWATFAVAPDRTPSGLRPYVFTR
ncbi:ATP-binding protein [Nocardiopsis sp. NRRL B-16309]|uniref:ATP-binding protein n=1 Tax=Nocardiopsis sp. NRRL B-16309 TaxID=1519494 RepID=UPI0006B05766|nr:ATP-binding protein [Nocardiopsis sp. NRRL B-16309]KOX17113.1 histidine kinase [Nocardiopsis sp. NRRL B-16309]